MYELRSSVAQRCTPCATESLLGVRASCRLRRVFSLSPQRQGPASGVYSPSQGLARDVHSASGVSNAQALRFEGSHHDPSDADAARSGRNRARKQRSQPIPRVAFAGPGFFPCGRHETRVSSQNGASQRARGARSTPLRGIGTRVPTVASPCTTQRHGLKGRKKELRTRDRDLAQTDSLREPVAQRNGRLRTPPRRTEWNS